MKKKVVAGFMAATMMVSVMSTGVFAKDLDPSSETQRTGDTTVTATVEENLNKADYIISIPETVDFGKIQQPETEGNAYSYKDITVSCIKADNLGAGNGIAVLVKDATAAESSDPFLLTHNTHSDCALTYEIIFQIVAGVKKFQDSKGKAILAIVCGVLSIIVSIIAFTHPVLTMFSVGYMIAFAVLMQGINMIVLAVNFGKESE